MDEQKSFIAGKEIDAEKLKMLQDFQQIENYQDYAYWMFEERMCNPDCAIKGSEECNLLRRIKKCYEYSASCIVIARNSEEAYLAANREYTSLQDVVEPLVYHNFEFEEDFADIFEPEDAEEICRFNFKKHLKYMDMYK